MFRMMALAELLGALPLDEFLERNLFRQPLAVAGGAKQFMSLAGEDAIAAMLSPPDADLFLADAGKRREFPFPRTLDDARGFIAAGCTLCVRHAERHTPELAELARSFERDFSAAIDVQFFWTPAGHRGFDWHYDAEEVFILQSRGTKRYSLRKNTVHPWPLVETMGENLAYEREIMPIMRCALDAGDWLYIPSGYWHRTEAEEESVSLAVGVMAPAAVDLLLLLREYLSTQLPWRGRLPTLSRSADEMEWLNACREQLAPIADDLSRAILSEEFLRGYLAWRKNNTAR